MATLKVPSALHLARLWRPDANATKKALLGLFHSSPPFSYAQLLNMLRSMLAFKTELNEMEGLVTRGIKSAIARKSYIEIVPLLRECFLPLNPTFVQEATPRQYPLNRELRIPFNPPMIYGAEGRVHLPVFIFWRTNPLSLEQLCLFGSLLREFIAQDPDLDIASVCILDFSVAKGEPERTLRRTPLLDIPSISRSRRDEMLSIFAEGFSLARSDLSERRAATNPPATLERPDSSSHLDLFD
jgi:hypothetical protein